MSVKLRGRRVIFSTSGTPPELPQANLPKSEEACPWCARPMQGHPRVNQRGSHKGNSITLARHIFEGRNKEEHPWYAGVFSLQAHHLICSEAMDDDFWQQVCWVFGYDINHRNNGVMLPFRMALACQVRAPLHRGNHERGLAGEPDLNYPNGVKRKLGRVREQIESGRFCAQPASLRERLDTLSQRILTAVDDFRWTLTEDGPDYAPQGPGCRGARLLATKRKALAQSSDLECPEGRSHGIGHARTGSLLLPRTESLKVGD